jgi:hypothetical protein
MLAKFLYDSACYGRFLRFIQAQAVVNLSNPTAANPQPGEPRPSRRHWIEIVIPPDESPAGGQFQTILV